MDNKKMICLDLDNTLILSDKTHIEAYNRALNYFGYEKYDQHCLIKLFGRPKIEIANVLMPEKNLKEQKEFLKMHDKFLTTRTYKYAKKVKGVDFVLKKLKKHYIIAVVSNTVHESIIYLLKGSKLNPNYFDLVLGSDEVKNSKPCPDEILKAKKLLHHKPEYMVGDSIYDLIAAKKAKVNGIGVLTGHHSKKEMMMYKPVVVLKSIADLPKFLKIG
ncbi:HAD family hydrolase [Candidatus Woesearchaeota archaeon]|nr:HAD family hydrolase [Candidatus Woesearchaeota archaeon]